MAVSYGLSTISTAICCPTLFVTCILAVGALLADARAEDTPGPVAQKVEHIVLRFKEAEKAAEKRLLSEGLRLEFYGYLEGSYTQNFNNPSNRINELRIFDVNSNQFRPNLAQFVLEREVKAGESGRLFGTVKPADVAAAVEAAGLGAIDKRNVELPNHIKSVGSYTANVRLHEDVSAVIDLEVVAGK